MKGRRRAPPPTVPPPTVEDTAKWIQTHVAPGYYEQGGATVPHGPPTTEEAACFHGGVSWEKTGLDFAKRDAIVVADVLDAPFPPPPELLAELRENLHAS